MIFKVKSTQALMRERGIEQGGKVQKFIDSEVVRLMAPYTPMQTGTLRDSAFSSTTFGSGEVKQRTPYARKQYYDERMKHRGMQTHHWFEVMKKSGGKETILREARRLAGAEQ